nr:copia protein [Tanacetum cinerariifolium]
MQKVWVLVDLPHGKRTIVTKWVYRNKRDERGIVVRNIARLIAQGHTHDEGIDYEEVFAPVAGIESIRIFLAYASFMGFMVYQMNVKSVFLYETIEEEVYVCQPSGFEDPNHPDKDYKVVKALYGLHHAPKACQDKYVAKILRKFGLPEGKLASTPIDTENPLLKDPDGEDVDVHTCRSMIGSLMYLTSSRPDIMFACKKQTVVATSSTEAEYVAAASCCTQVLWIQNQLLDYGSAMTSAVICLSIGDDTTTHGEVLIISQEPSIPSLTPPTPTPQPPQDLPSTSQRIDTSDDTVMDDESNQGRIIDEMDKDDVVALMDDKEEDKKDEEAKVVDNT